MKKFNRIATGMFAVVSLLAGNAMAADDGIIFHLDGIIFHLQGIVVHATTASGIIFH